MKVLALALALMLLCRHDQTCRAVDRNHVEVLLLPDEPGLQASGLAFDGTTLWVSNNPDEGMTVEFADGNTITIEPSMQMKMFDVYLGNRFTHTCRFRDGKTHGSVCIIVRDKYQIRVAESSDSVCIPSYILRQQETRWNEHRKSPCLRTELLKAKIQHAMRDKESHRRVRFLI